jgi:FMN phosphatase YigB (HAD superfamily)
MKTYKIILSFVFCFLFFSLSAKIIESNSIADIAKHITKDTLLIFDLDNTIMETKEYSGSDQWFEALIAHFINNEKMEIAKALSIVLPKYEKAHKKAEVLPVESCTVTAIDKLQKSGCKVIGLTARGDKCIPYTFRQLSSIKVDLSRAAIYTPQTKKLNLVKPAEYQQGIVFCYGANKGKILADFFNKIKNVDKTFKLPKKIVFVDDKEKNVLAIEEAAQNLSIEFTGIRYGFLDKKVAQFKLTPDMLSPFKEKAVTA